MLLSVELVGEEPPLELPPGAALISSVSPLEVARGSNRGRSHEGRAVLAPQVSKTRSRCGVAGGAVATRQGPFGCTVAGESGDWQVPRVAVGRLPPLAQGWLRWMVLRSV